MEYILAYDFGTSGVKAALVNREGTICAVKEHSYPLLRPRPLYVEQRPDDFWEAVCMVTRGAVQEAGIDPALVKGLSFGVQSFTITPVDADGNVLYNAVSWLDGRAEKQAEEINALVGFEIVRSQDFQSRLLWFKEKEPEIYENAKYFLDCNGYLQWKATGVMAVPDDYEGIMEYNPAFREYLDVTLSLTDASKIAPIVQAYREYGRLDDRGAADLGLCAGTPVFGGMVDVPAAAAGCGCINSGDAHLYLGSSGWLSALIDHPYETSEGSYQIPAVDPSLLVYGGCTNCCCLMFDWTMTRFYKKEYEELGNSIYPLVDGEAEQIPAGCDGLLAVPWLFGEQFPISDPFVRASFFNINQDHTRAHFIRAVMESVCFSMRGQIDLYYKDTGQTISRIGANGGGANSDVWMQIMADVLQIPVAVPRDARHSGAIGAAFATAVGLGWCKPDEIDRFVTTEKEFLPDPEKKEIYDRQYALFMKYYQTIKDLSREINEE